MKHTLLAFGVAAALAAPALAQDAAKVDPKHYQTVAENERVRVLKATVEAGDVEVILGLPDARVSAPWKATITIMFDDADPTNPFFGGPWISTPPSARLAMMSVALRRPPALIGGPP